MNETFALETRIQQLIELKRFAEAKATAHDAIAEYPSAERLYLLGGIATEGLGETYDAITLYERSCALGPSDHMAFGRLGMALRSVNQHDDADRALERMRMLAPEDPWVVHVAINDKLVDPRPVRNRKALREQVDADLKTLLRLAPSEAATFATKASYHYILGEFEQSKKWARQALSLDPNLADAHRIWGQALGAIGDAKGSGDAFVSAGKIDVHSNSSRELLGSMQDPALVRGFVAIFAVSVLAMLAWRFSNGDKAPWVSVVGILVIALVATVLIQVTAFLLERRLVAALSPTARDVYLAERAEQGRGSPTFGRALDRDTRLRLWSSFWLSALLLIVLLPVEESIEIEPPEVESEFELGEVPEGIFPTTTVPADGE